MSRLDPMMEELDALPSDVLEEIDRLLDDELGHMPIVPTYGPQLEAYEHEADEIFYGGSAGGGKSALAIGLALSAHRRSLVMRRFVADAKKFAEQALEIVGSRKGYNGQDMILRLPNRLIRWGGCNEEKDKQRYKGDPYDLHVFDELPDFLESQYVFITTWNRTTRTGQRCRVVCTGNPPTTAEGLWVIKRWAPWLDPTHPNPAKSGEIRWFVRDEQDQDVEVDGPGEYDVGGSKMVKARSRTFIRAKLDDNPDLTVTDDYERALDALPIEMRAAYRDGDFDASLKDNPNQMIPTEWIKAAFGRWRPLPPHGIPMCAIGVDGARKHDDTVLAARHDGYYPKLTVVKGTATPEGTDLAALIIKVRRGDALPIIDCIESVGSQAYAHLKDMDITVKAFRGYDECSRTSKDGRLGFNNARTASYWAFREALDPSQDGGSPISLCEDHELMADLTAITWEPYSKAGSTAIRALSKDKVLEKLGGRSPNKGDAVVMAWWDGPRASSHMQVWQPDERVAPGRRSHRRPIVNMGPRRVSKR